MISRVGASPGDADHRVFRWICFVTVILIACALSYIMYVHGQTEDIIAIAFMMALVCLFYGGDDHVDDVFAKDARHAEHEENS